MGKTKIEWTESSWNPITGCTKISDGCQNCYAATFAKRLKAMGNPRYINGFNVTVHYDLIKEPLSWKKPQRIFVNSMSDIFHETISDEVILQIFKTMNEAHWHTFQILTKRVERLLELSSKIEWTPNIWMGVTVENDKYIYRSDLLKRTNAKIKFISAEPLLGSIKTINLNGIDWIIVGGESGYASRPIKREWIIELKNLAHQNGTAFFFKQWGGYNKKKSGSMLDDQYYKEYPTV